MIDKDAGLSSFDVIRRLRKITGIRKMGHAGTLDPFATGLLPVFAGKITRLLQYLSTDDKTYQAEVELGRETDTGDPEGRTIRTSLVAEITPDLLREATRDMKAITSQIPPAFSAVKKDGVRAYRLARNGEQPQLEPRPVRIHEFEITNVQRNQLCYRARVSKGTYIRELSRSLGGFLGCAAVTVRLRRVAVGTLDISRAVTLEQLSEGDWTRWMLPVERVLSQLPVVRLAEALKPVIAHGRSVDCETKDAPVVFLHGPDDSLWGVGEIMDHHIQPRMVFL